MPGTIRWSDRQTAADGGGGKKVWSRRSSVIDQSFRGDYICFSSTHLAPQSPVQHVHTAYDDTIAQEHIPTTPSAALAGRKMSISSPSGSPSADNLTHNPDGQRHDRIPSRHEDPVDTSLSQKMLSAVTGSLLTSLLGILLSLPYLPSPVLIVSQSHPSTLSASAYNPKPVRLPLYLLPLQNSSVCPPISASRPAAEKSFGFKTSLSSALPRQQLLLLLPLPLLLLKSRL